MAILRGLCLSFLLLIGLGLASAARTLLDYDSRTRYGYDHPNPRIGYDPGHRDESYDNTYGGSSSRGHGIGDSALGGSGRYEGGGRHDYGYEGRNDDRGVEYGANGGGYGGVGAHGDGYGNNNGGGDRDRYSPSLGGSGYGSGSGKGSGNGYGDSHGYGSRDNGYGDSHGYGGAHDNGSRSGGVGGGYGNGGVHGGEYDNSKGSGEEGGYDGGYAVKNSISKEN